MQIRVKIGYLFILYVYINKLTNRVERMFTFAGMSMADTLRAYRYFLYRIK